MGLIEKAYQDQTSGKSGQRQGQAQDSRSQDGHNNVRPMPDGCRQFDLDFTLLAHQGFFVPGVKSTQLSLELRLLKRRLLRKLGFLRTKANPDVVMARPSKRRNVVMMTSTRPAEGKTFTAANLALSLALEDEIDVLLVDGDSPRPKLQSHFGLREQGGFTDLIMDNSVKLRDVALKARQCPLTILPEGSPIDYPGELFGSAEGQKVITELAASGPDRLVIIDAPPVLATTEAVILAPFVDEILFVVEADATPEQAIASAVEEILDVNPNISLILNKCLIGAGGSHYGSYSEYYPRGSRRSAAKTPQRRD